MRYRNHLILLLCLVVGSMFLTPIAWADPAVDEYELIDLGAGFALAVNDRGEVVGNGQPSPSGHAFVWQPDGTMTDLHVVAGWGSQSWSSAYGINKHGEIVAQACCEENQTYYVDWDRRTGKVSTIEITVWPSPGGINRHGAVVGGEMGDAYLWTLKDGRVGLAEDGLMNAVRINDHGQVLGITSSHFVPGGYPDGLHFVIRERDGGLTHVAYFEMTGPPPGVPDINNRGQVVYTVSATTSINVVGVLWDAKDGVTEYEGLSLTAINDHGVMAGSTATGEPPTPVLVSSDGSLVELPVPEGWSGRGLDLNNKGVAVGTLQAPDGQHAVVWIPTR